jgi:hypothetical protein
MKYVYVQRMQPAAWYFADRVAESVLVYSNSQVDAVLRGERQRGKYEERAWCT